MKRHLAEVYLSNTLLLGFASAWLVLIFIPLWIASDHSMGLWYEDNLVILALELSVCVFSIAWSISRIVYYMKRNIAKLRSKRHNYVKGNV